MRRTRAFLRAWIALAGIGCTAMVEPLDLESPEDGAFGEREDLVPEATEPADSTPAPTPVEPQARAACTELLGDAVGSVRADLEALCGATNHDGSCVGFLCETTAPRDAFECLLEAGHAERVIALEHADVPAARAFAREALTRARAWNTTRIREALHDQTVVTECSGCICDTITLDAVGLQRALSDEDRAMMEPLLAEWAATTPPPTGLAQALQERPTEGWISTPRLHALVADPAQDAMLRTSVAYALARRSDDTGREVLEDATRDREWRARDLAVRGLDALDDGDAWDRLAPLLEDDTGNVRISLMRLGARLRPDDAVAALDAASLDFGALALPELPTRLFAPRAVRAICGHRDGSESERERLVTALEQLPQKARCRALVKAQQRCSPRSEPGAIVHDLAPALASACGIAAPPATPEPDVPSVSRCHRTLQQGAAARREQLLELERRAREAADAAR